MWKFKISRMEDLYGKTVNKPGLTPLELGKSSLRGTTAFNNLSGRISPIETSNKSSSRQPSAFSPGRLTPIDTSTNNKPQAQTRHHHHHNHVSRDAVYGTRDQNGLLNVSSHNSSKLSSSNSGSNVTKTTVDLSHHELNSTQISPISAARRPLVDTSHHSSHVSNTSHHNGGLNLTARTNDTLSREPRDHTRVNKTGNVSNFMLLTTEAGVKEMIQSLGLLCLVSLLLALGEWCKYL